MKSIRRTTSETNLYSRQDLRRPSLPATSFLLSSRRYANDIDSNLYSRQDVRRPSLPVTALHSSRRYATDLDSNLHSRQDIRRPSLPATPAIQSSKRHAIDIDALKTYRYRESICDHESIIDAYRMREHATPVETSTLGSYAVVLHWVYSSEDVPEFPSYDFHAALEHDLQGYRVLLEHTTHLKNSWQASRQPTRFRKMKLNVYNLLPRLAHDHKKMIKLERFCNAEAGTFARDLSPRASFMICHSMTMELLNLAQATVQELVSEIQEFAEEYKPATPVSASDYRRVQRLKCRRGVNHPGDCTCQREDDNNDTVQVAEVAEMGARYILMRKPITPPVLVSCRGQCERCYHSPCNCAAVPKSLARSDSVMECHSPVSQVCHALTPVCPV